MSRTTLLIAGLVIAVSSAAQDRRDIFADPQNLKVLPEDISSADLRATMRRFAMQTGARCETCHVGEAGQPLETFDFAADDLEQKETARTMLRMLASINDEYMNSLGDERMQVDCITCHRGVLKPRTTGQEIQLALDDGGADAATARYRELRDQYYGTHSYDFSENVLGDLAQSLGRSGNAEDGLALLAVNDEFFPNSFQNHWLQGEMYILLEDKERATERLSKALELDASPRFKQFVQQRLDSLSE